MLTINKEWDDACVVLEIHNVDANGKYRLNDVAPPVQQLILPRSWPRFDDILNDLHAQTTSPAPQVWWGGYVSLLQEFLETLILMIYVASTNTDRARAYAICYVNFEINYKGLYLCWTRNPSYDEINDLCYIVNNLLGEERFRFLRWAFKPVVYHRWQIVREHDEEYWMTLPWDTTDITGRLRAELRDIGNVRFLDD